MNIAEQGLDPADLDKFVLLNKNNKISARIGMIATFYFTDPHDTNLRTAVGECVDEYHALVKPHLNWLGNEEIGTHKLSNYKLPSMKELLKDMLEYWPFEFQSTSAEKIQEAGAFNLDLLMEGLREFKHLGYLSISFPLSFLQQHEAGFFQHLVHDWCRRLKPYHGYAGLGFIRNAEYSSAMIFDPNLYPYLKRFPGLEYDNPASHSLYLTDGIKGVNWLTILSNEFLDKLGGLDSLKAQLSDDFLYYEYPEGAMIQAGPHPQIGDSEQGNIPKQYQELYRLIQPVQASYNKSLLKTPEGVDSDAFAQEWLHRFE